MEEQLVRTHVEDMTLVALSPGDVPGEQQKLVDWCARKAEECNQERSDLLDNARIAKRNNWAFLSMERLARKAELRAIYYDKIGAAAKAGYLIVPNFDVEVMAVRVKRHGPRWGIKSEYQHTAEVVKAELLPAGEGRYVDETAFTSAHEEHTGRTDGQGKALTTTIHQQTRFDDSPDFPVRMVKPQILEATERAMALKIFDRIGVVTGRKEDPVVVGQIIDPRRPYRLWGQPKVVSFFIAWWLDTRAL